MHRRNSQGGSKGFLIRFSPKDQVRDIPMGKLNIKQRISDKSSKAAEAEADANPPPKFKVVKNKSIQEDRWDPLYDDSSLYALMVESLAVYTCSVEEALETYHSSGDIDDSIFDLFEDSYNEYLDYIEESIYHRFDADAGDDVGAALVSLGNVEDSVPFVDRDDISSIRSDDSCHCSNCVLGPGRSGPGRSHKGLPKGSIGSSNGSPKVSKIAGRR